MSRTYSRMTCPCCKEQISTAGVSKYNHFMKHVREGKMQKYFEPCFDLWMVPKARFRVIAK